MKKIVCVLLSLCLCIGFCSCQKQSIPPSGDTIPQTVDVKEVTVDAENYSKQAGVLLDAGMSELSAKVELDAYSSAYAGGYIWMLGRLKESGSRALARMDTIAGEHTVLELIPPESDAARIAAPPQGERLAITYSLIGTDETLPLLLRQVIHLEDSDEVYRQLYYEFELCTVNADGNVSEGITLPVEMQGDYLTLGCTDENGVWFLNQRVVRQTEEFSVVLATPQLRCYDVLTGELLYTVDMPHNWYGTSLRPLGGGNFVQVGVSMPEDGNGMIYPGDERLLVIHDAAGKARVGEPIEPPDAFDGFDLFVLPANGLQTLYLADSGALWQWDMEKNRFVKLHRWFDAGIQTRNGWLYALEEGVFCQIAEGNVNGEQQVELWMLGGETAVQTDERQVITVGVLGSGGDIANAVKAFERSSGMYTVQLTYYDNDAAKAAGLSSGIELLHRALLQGAAPDVVVTGGGLNLVSLVNKGVFADLYGFVDADEALDRADFVAGPLAAGEYGGQLYSVIPQYSIATTVGSEKKLGAKTEWSWEEYTSLTKGIQAPIYGWGRSTVLNIQALAFVDHVGGEAHMDTGSFISLLEQSTAWPETMGYYNTENCKERFSSGQSAVALAFIGGFENIRGEVYAFDGPVVYKGFPDSGSMLVPGMQLSINAACADKQAAWQFVRYFLLPEYQSSLQGALPLRRDALAAKAEAAQQPLVDEHPDDGIAYGVPNYLDSTTTNQEIIAYWTRGLTSEETDKVVALAEATDTLYHIDGTIQEIIEEEAVDFYNNLRTAEEAAQLIQNRVQTYLAEQG